MFIGHFGAGFAGKKIDPRLSLGTLFLASQFIDLLWPLFLVLGIEHVSIDPGNTAFTPLNFYYYPFSHSLIGVLFWAVIFGSVYFLMKKKWQASLLLGVLVLSHWVLDLIVHRPDLPILLDNNIKAGFGLWDSILLTVVIEGIIFTAGIFLYMKSTEALNKKGTYGIWGLIIFLTIIYIMNIFTHPDNTDSIGYAGFAQWLLILWAYWADKNRTQIKT